MQLNKSRTHFSDHDRLIEAAGDGLFFFSYNPYTRKVIQTVLHRDSHFKDKKNYSDSVHGRTTVTGIKRRLYGFSFFRLFLNCISLVLIAKLNARHVLKK